MSVHDGVEASGVIVPCAWDGAHRVSAIALSTTAEVELRLDEESGRGPELRAWMHGRLHVSGYLDAMGHLVVLDYAPEEDE